MDQRDIELSPMSSLAPMDLLNRESVMAMGGQPESIDTSDPDTEHYFADSEMPDYSPPDPFSDRNAVRADSKTPALPIANLARSVQTKSHAALLQPPSSKAPGKRAAQRRCTLQSRPSASEQELIIHPAHRTERSTSNAAFSIFEQELRYPSFASPIDVPSRELPVYASPTRRSRVAPPVQPPHLQPRRSFSSMFQFGRSNTYNFEVTTNNEPPKPFRKRSKDKINGLGQRLTNLNLTGKAKQIVGLKRSRQGSPTANADVEPLHKISKTNADRSIHCQTCQCHAAVRNSLAEHSNKRLRQQPSPPPPRPGLIRRTTTVSVTESPPTSEYMTPRDGLDESHATAYQSSSHYSGSNCTQYPDSSPGCNSDSDSNSASSRSTPYHNEDALAILEGRSDRLWHEAPPHLTRENPETVLSYEQTQILAAAIAARFDRFPEGELEVEDPFSDALP